MLPFLGVPLPVFLQNFPASLRKHLRLTEPHFGWEVNRERTVAKINTFLKPPTSFISTNFMEHNFLLYYDSSNIVFNWITLFLVSYIHWLLQRLPHWYYVVYHWTLLSTHPLTTSQAHSPDGKNRACVMFNGDITLWDEGRSVDPC